MFGVITDNAFLVYKQQLAQAKKFKASIICFQLSVPRFTRVIFVTLIAVFFLQTQQRMTLLSNEDNKEISLSTELCQASTEKVTLLVHVHRTKNL